MITDKVSRQHIRDYLDNAFDPPPYLALPVHTPTDFLIFMADKGIHDLLNDCDELERRLEASEEARQREMADHAVKLEHAMAEINSLKMQLLEKKTPKQPAEPEA
ncbi:MAG: hypothetical protein LBC63_02460 [Holophagales bacterium]|nr:hypothetical protein [Holophagales bacterium]